MAIANERLLQDIYDDIRCPVSRSSASPPETVLPELDCDEPAPDAILCESADHTISPSGRVLHEAKMNTGVFLPSLIQLTSGPDEIEFEPNDVKHQSVFQGDSGSGCKDLISLKLSVIMHGARNLHDNDILAPLRP